MRPLLPMVFASVLLGGCPDSRIPKAPPQVPEPKLAPDARVVMPCQRQNCTMQASAPWHSGVV